MAIKLNWQSKGPPKTQRKTRFSVISLEAAFILVTNDESEIAFVKFELIYSELSIRGLIEPLNTLATLERKA